MRYVAATIALVALLALAPGCYHVIVRTQKAPTGMAYSTKAHMFLFGVVGAEVLAPCDPAVVETQRSVLDWFLASLTAGVYTPYTVTVHCSGQGGGPQGITPPPGPPGGYQ